MANIAMIPYDAAIGAEIDDTTSTAVSEGAGGRSARFSVRQPKLRNFHLTVIDTVAVEVRAIFDTHRRRWPVTVRDWGHYQITTPQVLDFTSNSSDVFAPIWEKIQPSTGTRFIHQRILIPDENEVPSVIYIDSVALPRGDWVYEDFGIAVIPLAHVPSGAVITWTGNALVPACFMQDELTVKVERDGLISIQDVQLREIFEDELIDLMSQPDDSE